MTDVAGGLITLEYMLEGLGYGAKQDAPEGELSVRDADIAAYIRAATPIIESLSGPVLARTNTIYRSGGKSAVLISGRIADAAAITAVRVDGQAYTGFVVDVESGIIYASQSAGIFPPGTLNIQIDVTVGYAVIPDALQLATRELIRHWIQGGKEAPAAGVLQLAVDGGETDDPYAIPRRVRQLCAPFAGGGFA